jgi:hypothetical protein
MYDRRSIGGKLELDICDTKTKAGTEKHCITFSLLSCTKEETLSVGSVLLVPSQDEDRDLIAWQ